MHMQPAMEVEEMPDAVYAPASPCSLFVTVIVTDDELQFDAHTGASPGSSGQ
jgi:hypothetical protein